MVALCCGGLAVLSANVSAMIPASVMAGLHASPLEVSLPAIMEQLAPGGVDASAVTASIPSNENGAVPAEGGSVAVETRPLFAPPVTAPADQPMPDVASVQAPRPDPNAFALAIGPQVTAATAPKIWDDLNGKVGALLIGLAPLIEGDRIVAGPIKERSDAVALCTQLALVNVACTPVIFTGAPL
jgi:hypothetical protein